MCNGRLRGRGIPEASRRPRPTAGEPHPRDHRQGADDRAGRLPPIPPGRTPIVAHPRPTATPFGPPAIQDHPDAADRAESALDLGEQERTIARDDRIAQAGGKVASRTLGTDAVGHQGVPGLALRDGRSAPRADGPHGRGWYSRPPRSAKCFLADVAPVSRLMIQAHTSQARSPEDRKRQGGKRRTAVRIVLMRTRSSCPSGAALLLWRGVKRGS